MSFNCVGPVSTVPGEPQTSGDGPDARTDPVNGMPADKASIEARHNIVNRDTFQSM
jgi:hypothetical protein